MKKSKYNRLLVTGFFIITLTGILLPGILLRHIFEANLDKVAPVPKEYYSSTNPAVSQYVAKRLSEYEKMELISGAWDSTRTAVSPTLSQITEMQAVDYAKSAVKELYQEMLYPYNFESKYDNWYTWKADFFQYTDNTFHTYSSYCWQITFYKYNTDEFHEILITEAGTLLNIRTNQSMYTSHSVSQQMEEYFQHKLAQGLDEVSSLKITDPFNLPAYGAIPSEKLYYRYAYIFAVGKNPVLIWNDLDQLSAQGMELYCVYQYTTPEGSGLTFIPWKQ